MKKEELANAYKKAHDVICEISNEHSLEERRFFAVLGIIDTIRENELYLKSYAELIPPKLKCVIHGHITEAKKEVCKIYMELLKSRG